MTNQSINVDRVFRALGDATRIAVVERLSRGRASASDLARPFDMALPSFTQHLNILEDCGLVSSQKNGRIRTYELQRENFAVATTWLEKQRQMWTTRLDQLDTFLNTTKEENP